MSSPRGPAAKTERLLNLVLCLLYTRRPLPKSKIRESCRSTAPRSPTRPSTGCSSATRTSCASWASPARHRGDQLDLGGRDRLPDRPARVRAAGHRLRARRAGRAGPGQPHLGPRLPGRARRPGAAQAEADGIERDVESLIGIEPRLRTTEPAFDEAKNAVLLRQVLEFDYRTAARDRPAGDASSRGVSRPGTAAGTSPATTSTVTAPRVFRLSRISGPARRVGRHDAFEVPADHRPRDMIRTTEGSRPRSSMRRCGPARARAVPASPCHPGHARPPTAGAWSRSSTPTPSPSPTR